MQRERRYLRTMSVVMVILDGWGEAPLSEGNGVMLANPEIWSGLVDDGASVLLRTDGLYVGLPRGQMGNSEVGHLTIGAGRIIEQDLSYINRGILLDSAQDKWLACYEKLRLGGRNRVHMVGLASNGGVHSHLDHWIAMTKKVLQSGCEPVWHLMLDGRDTLRGSACDSLKLLYNEFVGENVTFATVMGRFYGMDRDNRMDRTKAAYRAIMYGKGLPILGDWYEEVCALSEKLSWGEGDASEEMLEPRVMFDYRGVGEGDGLLSVNFRSDRVRQILRSLLWGMGEDWFTKPWSFAAGMADYADDLSNNMITLFEKPQIGITLSEAVSKAGLHQLKVAESEKYAHVTYFLNGGIEAPWPNEDRVIIPSPAVTSYDETPKMSAEEVTQVVVDAICAKKYDLLVVNFANPDMLGHTGTLRAVVDGVRYVDRCLGRIVEAIKSTGAGVVILADHGNAEEMIDPKTGKPSTSHSLNPVRLVCLGDGIMLNQRNKDDKSNHFGLADVAPSVLSLLGVSIPNEMTGFPIFTKSTKKRTHSEIT